MKRVVRHRHVVIVIVIVIAVADGLAIQQMESRHGDVVGGQVHWSIRLPQTNVGATPLAATTAVAGAGSNPGGTTVGDIAESFRPLLSLMVHTIVNSGE